MAAGLVKIGRWKSRGHPAAAASSLVPFFRYDAQLSHRGTLWTIIIDKQGVVHFNGFRTEAGDAIHVLATLKEFEG